MVPGSPCCARHHESETRGERNLRSGAQPLSGRARYRRACFPDDSGGTPSPALQHGCRWAHGIAGGIQSARAGEEWLQSDGSGASGAGVGPGARLRRCTGNLASELTMLAFLICYALVAFGLSLLKWLLRDK